DDVSFVRDDELEPARLAAQHLTRPDFLEQIACGEVARSSEPDLLAEGAEEPEGAPEPRVAQPARRLDLAEGVELHVGAAQAVERPLLLGQRPRVAGGPGPCFLRSRRNGVEMGDEEEPS